MNDNHHPPASRHAQRQYAMREAAYIAELDAIATRAVMKPESLTMGEIQEIGWGVLVAARTGHQGPSTRAHEDGR